MRMVDKIVIHFQRLVATRSLKLALKDVVGLVGRRIKPVHDPEEYLETYMDSSGMAFIDVGAAIGMWTLFMANKNVQCYSFEPSPIAFKILETVTRKYKNIKVYQYALGMNDFIAYLNVHSHPGYDSILYKSKEFLRRVPVEVKTLDSFAFKDVGLIKIDTEGYEVPILIGAVDTIKQNKPRLIIEVHFPFDVEQSAITDLLISYGYGWTVKYKANGQPHIIADWKGYKP